MLSFPSHFFQLIMRNRFSLFIIHYFPEDESLTFWWPFNALLFVNLDIFSITLNKYVISQHIHCFISKDVHISCAMQLSISTPSLDILRDDSPTYTAVIFAFSSRFSFARIAVKMSQKVSVWPMFVIVYGNRVMPFWWFWIVTDKNIVK